ncbi:MAG TPA: hypothetical protein VFE05_24335 [Longimicrobiaceae bacterium]|jgi:hypothetical protein|nr:hypothetical protein [Longimicrobiaceae bacterium]
MGKLAPKALPGHQALRNLHKRLHDPRAAEVTARALEALDCELFLKEYEQAYSDLRDNPGAWAEVEAERRGFDASLMDGIEPEEP